MKNKILNKQLTIGMRTLLWCFIAFITLWTTGATGQTLGSYSFVQSNGTYKQAGLGASLTTTGTYDDASFASVTLPFSFTYHGTSFSSVVVNPNGNIRFGTSGYGSYTPVSSSTDVLSIFGGDLYGNTANGGNVTYATTGNTPNRIFTVQWTNWGFYSSGLNEAFYQIRLYETSNSVQFVYGPAPGTGVKNVQVGLNGSSSADFQNRSTATDWNSTIAGGTNTATCTVNSTVRPTNGLTFTWTAAPTVAAMGFSQSATIYTPVEAAVAAGTFTPTAGFYDDANFGTAAIPFSFNYHGSPFSTVSVGPNGYVQFSATSSSLGYSAICSYPNVLSALNADLYGNTNATIRGDVSYFTIGTAPNRVFVIQYSNWGFYSSALNEISFQYRLAETTNAIQFVYGPQPGVGTRTVYVGLTGTTTSEFIGRTTTSRNWAAATASPTYALPAPTIHCEACQWCSILFRSSNFHSMCWNTLLRVAPFQQYGIRCLGQPIHFPLQIISMELRPLLTNGSKTPGQDSPILAVLPMPLI